MKNDTPKEPKGAKAERDGVMNPHNYNFNQFLHGKFWCSQNATNEAKSRKYQGVFEVKSRVKTWQVRGIWSQQLEH